MGHVPTFRVVYLSSKYTPVGHEFDRQIPKGGDVNIDQVPHICPSFTTPPLWLLNIDVHQTTLA